MTSAAKHTAGAAKVREFDTVFEVRSEDGVRLVTTSWHSSSHWYPTKGEARANVHLIAEAFNVAHETGLTPRQLAEQRDELLAALKYAREMLDSYKTTHVGIHYEAIRRADAAIAKAEGGAK